MDLNKTPREIYNGLLYEINGDNKHDVNHAVVCGKYKTYGKTGFMFFKSVLPEDIQVRPKLREKIAEDTDALIKFLIGCSEITKEFWLPELEKLHDKIEFIPCSKDGELYSIRTSSLKVVDIKTRRQELLDAEALSQLIEKNSIVGFRVVFDGLAVMKPAKDGDPHKVYTKFKIEGPLYHAKPALENYAKICLNLGLELLKPWDTDSDEGDE